MHTIYLSCFSTCYVLVEKSDQKVNTPNFKGHWLKNFEDASGNGLYIQDQIVELYLAGSNSWNNGTLMDEFIRRVLIEKLFWEIWRESRGLLTI